MKRKWRNENDLVRWLLRANQMERVMLGDTRDSGTVGYPDITYCIQGFGGLNNFGVIETKVVRKEKVINLRETQKKWYENNKFVINWTLIGANGKVWMFPVQRAVLGVNVEQMLTFKHHCFNSEQLFDVIGALAPYEWRTDYVKKYGRPSIKY